MKWTHIKKFENNPPYKDRGPTTNQSGEAVKIITQTCKLIKTVYQKYIKRPPEWAMEASSGQRTKGVPTNNQKGR